MSSLTRIQAETMQRFIAEVFQHLDMPVKDAKTAADVLVTADLRGVESHGVNNLCTYVDLLRCGMINPRPHITIVRESPVTALIDGDGGTGLVVGVRAMELCIAKAKEHGLSAVAVRRSKHFGIASYHAMLCLPHDMIGLSLTNNAGIAVVPTFGRQAMLATNPISVTAPAGQEPPFELDMATSIAAMGKISLALAKGEKKIPPGWALNKEGRPTDDPQEAWEARKALPIGGTPELGSHKGYGLGVAVDILTGVLAGGMYNNLLDRDPPADEKLRYSSSHFFAALRVDYFRPVQEFKAAMDDMMQALKASEKAQGHNRIYVAGEIEFETQQERSQQGIPYHPAFVKQMQELAHELGIPFEISAQQS